MESKNIKDFPRFYIGPVEMIFLYDSTEKAYSSESDCWFTREEVYELIKRLKRSDSCTIAEDFLPIRLA